MKFWPLILSCFAIGALVGYAVGRYVERCGWNDLIRSGRRPKPTSKR